MFAGSYGLSEFTDVRIKKREEKTRMLKNEELVPYLKKQQETLESMHEVKSKISDLFPPLL